MSVSSPSTERYICIHGHFYQPPRENPWLEMVETQDSAAPYHDWNDRITAECYAPNGASRILNGRNQIVRIVNNYSRISFNFGPTLLSWLEQCAARTYRMMREADRNSRTRFAGHGSALAQVYNHVIMPLASTRDRVTQIRWGIADFESRFGRKPEGMWLSETAVDLETLDLLAQNGIRFTILAPHQCARVRALSPEPEPPTKAAKTDSLPNRKPVWTETPDASVNTTRPYLVRCREGRSIAVFFYNGPISRAIAFEGLLNNGEIFAGRLLGGFRAESSDPQLVHVATDGESYGHHHRHGEMALSYALKLIEDNQLAHLTNYGEFLAMFPPVWQAEIAENTSWSCFHGVERWRSNCGCNGGREGWSQQWRAPLRAALDWLRDTIAPLTEQAAADLLVDVWAARDAYIDVVVHRAPQVIDRFLAPAAQGGQATRTLTQPERTRVLKLMEMQRHAMLMYTSCAWFFDDISGIETVQVIAYAARVLELAADVFRLDPDGLEGEFTTRLRLALSNVPELEDGAVIFEQLVKPLQVSLEQVAAHYAIDSMFHSNPDPNTLFCYSVRQLTYQMLQSGASRLAIGQVEITSNITEESETVSFAALHFGDQNVSAAVRRAQAEEQPAFEQLSKQCSDAISRGDVPEVVRLIDRFFGGSPYSLASLFADDQRRILRIILTSTLSQVENSLLSVYEEHASLLHFLSASGLPKPPALTLAAGFAVNAGLRRALESEPIDTQRVRFLLSLARADGIVLDAPALGYQVDHRMKRSMVNVQARPLDMAAVDSALAIARTVRELPFELNLWQAQNIWYDTLKESGSLFDHPQPDADPIDRQLAAQWLERFRELGRQLMISVDQLVVEIEQPLAGAPAAQAQAAEEAATESGPVVA